MYFKCAVISDLVLTLWSVNVFYLGLMTWAKFRIYRGPTIMVPHYYVGFHVVTAVVTRSHIFGDTENQPGFLRNISLSSELKNK